MSTFTDLVRDCYTTQGYNCAEAIIHAANQYYSLGLHEEDMKMLSGFGSGMYVGSSCGALIASNAVLSKLIVTDRAHAHLDLLRLASGLLFRNFKAGLSHSDCAMIKPKHYSKDFKCLETVSLAAEVLENTISTLHADGRLKIDLPHSETDIEISL